MKCDKTIVEIETFWTKKKLIICRRKCSNHSRKECKGTTSNYVRWITSFMSCLSTTMFKYCLVYRNWKSKLMVDLVKPCLDLTPLTPCRPGDSKFFTSWSSSSFFSLHSYVGGYFSCSLSLPIRGLAKKIHLLNVPNVLIKHYKSIKFEHCSKKCVW